MRIGSPPLAPCLLPTQCRHSHSHSHFPAALPHSTGNGARESIGHRESLPPSSERASRIGARRDVLQRTARVKTLFGQTPKNRSSWLNTRSRPNANPAVESLAIAAEMFWSTASHLSTHSPLPQEYTAVHRTTTPHRTAPLTAPHRTAPLDWWHRTANRTIGLVAR
jgi:hypothetical protein